MERTEISVVLDRAAVDEAVALFSDLTDNGVVIEPVGDVTEENDAGETEETRIRGEADEESSIRNAESKNESMSRGREVEVPENETADIRSRMRIVFFDEGDSADVRADVEERLRESGIAYESCDVRRVPVDDWRDAWKAYVEPIEIVPGIVVCPAWKTYDAKNGERVIVIDSDLDFGTGDHETTVSCARLIYRHAFEGDSLLDVGTGTGILAFVGEVLGYTDVVGIDIDAHAVETARANAARNGSRAKWVCGDLDADVDGRFDVVVANLTVDPLKRLLPTIGRKLSERGILIISGIVDVRRNEILPYIEADWDTIEEETNGSWHAFALRRKRSG